VEIVFGSLAVVLPIITFFLGVRHANRQSEQKIKADKFNTVLDRFMEFRKTNRTGGLDALQKAGVATLGSDSEIRRLIDMIMQHGEKNPLGSNSNLFDDIDLKKFFSFTAERNINFHTMRQEKLIDLYRRES
jgi:hypothetical protein